MGCLDLWGSRVRRRRVGGWGSRVKEREKDIIHHGAGTGEHIDLKLGVCTQDKPACINCVSPAPSLSVRLSDCLHLCLSLCVFVCLSFA